LLLGWGLGGVGRGVGGAGFDEGGVQLTGPGCSRWLERCTTASTQVWYGPGDG
jgi:hypothetical protein